MKLTDFKTKSAWVVGILAIISLWIAFPLIFKYWVFKLLVTPPFTTEAFASLGPIGDIFGGLTAFFTSLTLIIVLYSAYLQREANKDARDSMADQLKHAKDSSTEQLQQARDATAKQLRQARQALKQQLDQAREATGQQIANAKELANIQLEQARESMEQQLALAQATHEAQMKESKYSIFSNVFYTLLNQKHSRYLSLQTKKNDIHYSAQEIFAHLNKNLVHHLTNKWIDISELNSEKVREDYFSTMFEICNIANHSEIFSYFRIIVDLYELINRSELDEQEKAFFKKVLSNSITLGENAALFWIGSFRGELKQLFEKECIFCLACDDYMMPFAVKFYSKESFQGSDIKEIWDKYINQKTPA